MAEALATNFAWVTSRRTYRNRRRDASCACICRRDIPSQLRDQKYARKRVRRARLEGAIVNRFGLVTSPCDHCRIFSGEASEMRIASKSGANCVLFLLNRNMSLHCQLPIANFRLIPRAGHADTNPIPVRQPNANRQLAFGNRKCFTPRPHW